MTIANLVALLFDRFLEERMLRLYRFDDVDFYRNAETSGGNQVLLNPFMETEHDVAMKFGGFMEEYFIGQGLPYTVHAEIGLYAKSSRE